MLKAAERGVAAKDDEFRALDKLPIWRKEGAGGRGGVGFLVVVFFPSILPPISLPPDCHSGLVQSVAIIPNLY